MLIIALFWRSHALCHSEAASLLFNMCTFPYLLATTGGFSSICWSPHKQDTLLLLQAYQNVLKSGANVLAVLPFPNRFVTKDSKNEQERQKLVGLMQQYIASQPEPTNCSQPRIYLQQLPSTYFDFWSMPEARVHRMQDDKLHLTAYGYDMLGELLFGTISKHVPLKGCLCPVKTTAGGMRKQGTLSG